MFVRTQRPIRLASLALLGWSLLGCQTRPPYTGFETEEEVRQHIMETEMLHRRTRVEIKGGGMFPFDSDIEAGSGIAFKGTMEVYKNLFFGLEYGYFEHDIGENLEDYQKVFDTDRARGSALARDAEAVQWLQDFKRHNILFLFDYDFPLGDFWGEYTPTVRAGLGLGVLLVDATEVSQTFVADIDARLYATLLARPSVGITMPVHENITVFAEANADLALLELLGGGNEFTIDGELTGRRAAAGEVDFSAISIMGGISLRW